MNEVRSPETGLVVVPCLDLNRTLQFIVDQLGFRLDMIMPADSPRIAQVSGYGIRLRLEQCADLDPLLPPTMLRLPASLRHHLQPALADSAHAIAIEFDEPACISLSTPEISKALVNRLDDGAGWAAGRAGMHYRDLIPERLQGQVIASHIRIIEGGPVDDYVHYHRVGMQMIYCRRGWVRVVYEDQGEPFVMHAGDCVLQPPTIRHRVLESSAGLEVIELGSPAEHETWRDHDLTLPTASIRPLRSFDGQRFVRHVAADADWQELGDKVSFRDTGIAIATQGKATARVLKLAGDPHSPVSHSTQAADFRFLFVLDGEVELDDGDSDPISLASDDTCVLRSGHPYSLRAMTATEVLEISYPAD